MNNKLQKRKFLRFGLGLLLVLSGSLSAFAQNESTVRGTVIDAKNEPVIGASVILKGKASIGTATDLDGSFTLSIPAGNQTLVVSYLGMKTKEVTTGGKDNIKVILEDDQVGLQEVVVVGYGQQKKESVIGAITQTSGQVLERAGGVSNVGAALTGNLPGVTTMSSTGMPGEEDPQIVIRGATSWNNSQPLVLVDGIERPMSSLDINSVETISVLKDASATAVFGVKGANGVILITTKRGQEGKAVINVSINSTLKAPSKLPGKYDSYDALGLRNRVIESELGSEPDSWQSITPQDVINKYRYPENLTESERYPNVNWVDALFKNYTWSDNATLGISGGTKFVKYFANFDYLHEGDLFRQYDNGRGYQGGYGFNRINVRSNLDFQLTPTTVLSTNLAGSFGVKKQPYSRNWEGTVDYEYNMWSAVYAGAPDMFLPQYSNGLWGFYPPQKSISNSVETVMNAGVGSKTTTRINTDFTLQQDLKMLLKGLNFKGTVSWDNAFVELNRGINDLDHQYQSYWIDPDTGASQLGYVNQPAGGYDFYESIAWNPVGGFVDNKQTYRNLYYDLQLNYGASFGNNNVAAMGLFSRQETAQGSVLPIHREDWVGRLTYDFAKKYFLELNGSYDGSDKFGTAYRFGSFGSGAVGWMLSEEKFLKSLTFLDMLKLRASYGTIGDDNIGGVTNQFNDKYRWLYMTQWAYGGSPGSTAITLNGTASPYTWYRIVTEGNPNVHWETVYKTNFGADYSFLKGLFAGSIDFFNDNRMDVLVSGDPTAAIHRAVPSYFGAIPPSANLGKVQSRGYELELRINKKLNPNLRLWGNFNMTHAINKVKEADDPELTPDYQKKAGHSLNQAYSYIDNGIYNTWDQLYGSTMWDKSDNQKLPGNFNIIDYNGDGVINSDDNVPYAYSGTPQNTYNATVGFEWKGFSGFLQFYGVNDVTRQVVFTTFSGKLDAAFDEGALWSKDNTTNVLPLPRWNTTPAEYNVGTRYMFDGSYIRLKNMEIAYTFTSGWITKLGFQNLKLYVNGDNLWLWTRMPDDRESNFAGTGWASQGAYPTVKRYNFGIKFTL